MTTHEWTVWLEAAPTSSPWEPVVGALLLPSLQDVCDFTLPSPPLQVDAGEGHPVQQREQQE